MMSGTPVYMAPELLRGEPATVQSDIYALGVLLFHLVTGSFPVERGTVAELREAHESGRRRLLPDVRPDVPESYAQTVRRAIAPNPAERFQSVGELLQALSEQSQDDGARATAVTGNWRRWIALGPVAIVALAAAIYFAQPSGWFGAAEASIAVLPFANLSPQTEDRVSRRGHQRGADQRVSQVGQLAGHRESLNTLIHRRQPEPRGDRRPASGRFAADRTSPPHRGPPAAQRRTGARRPTARKSGRSRTSSMHRTHSRRISRSRTRWPARCRSGWPQPQWPT